MFVKFLFVGLLACVPSIYSASAPFIKKCQANDSNCMKASTQLAIPIFTNGIPELGVEKMDPFYMKTLDATSPNLALKLNEITGTGLKDCISKKTQFNADKSKLFVKLLCTVDFEGQYEIAGDLLVLRIQGNGRAHVVLRKALISVEANMEEVTGKDGLKHLKIKNYKHSYELKDKATVELENLFNGNELLGRAAQDLIRNNPNEIIEEAGPPIIKAVIAKIVGNIKRFFENVPLSDLVQ